MKSSLVVALASYASAHSVGEDKLGSVCALPFNDTTRVGEVSILSYHVHVLYKYDQEEAQQKLFDDVVKHFNLKRCSRENGPDDNWDEICAFPADTKPAGPWPVPQWAIYALPDSFEDIYSYIIQRRGDLTVMTHPNSGCATLDHLHWASWSGTVWPLFHVFKTEKQNPDAWRPNPHRPMHPQKYFDQNGNEVDPEAHHYEHDDEEDEDISRTQIRI